jgi:glycosyltransferase involved in cell wall biosynthesis
VGDAAALAAAIHRLLEDPLLAQELTARARQWVETECSVARMTEQYRRVYQAVLPC